MSIAHKENGPCCCPNCAGLQDKVVTEDSGDGRSPLMAPLYTNDQVIGQIDSGAKWTADQITYGFLQSSPSWDIGYEGDGFSAFTAYQADATRLVMSIWDDVIAPSFLEQTSNQQFANVKFGNTNTDIGYAHAYYPGNYSWAGEVWLNAPTYSGLHSPDPGDYYFMTILHEVGHAIGLSHPGAYNGGSPTYANDAVYAQDTHQWTVMSYFSASNTGADWNGGYGWQYAQTPMVHDVLTVQSIYGVETTTRTGDTVYGFNSNAEKWIYDFSQNATPVLTIYDAGGTDTLDLSGFSQRAIVNLEPGTYSSAGGVSSSMTYNIGIAFGAEIENAIGGNRNDIITGNALANVLSGLGGNDTLIGGSGNDRLDGGAGTDTAVFSTALADYLLLSFNDTIAALTSGTDGNDQLTDVEILEFSDQTVTPANATPFDPYEYLATYTDVIAAFGADGQCAFDHYLDHGFTEGRECDGFDNMEYLATYTDVVQAYGADEAAAARHFVEFGFGEGRVRDGFDNFEYLATYDELIQAFGADEAAAARHFVEVGFGEGWVRDGFANCEYLATYTDVLQAFGPDEGAAARHFVFNGFSEGRVRDGFDNLQYIASYGDLIQAFGADEEAAARHFVYNGFGEGRVRDDFDAAQYLANYQDLQAAFGSDEQAATLHFITNGFSEGRTDEVIM